MDPVYRDKCFTKPVIHDWCKKMPDRQKFALDIEVQSVIRQWFRHQPASLFASGIQKLGERTNV